MKTVEKLVQKFSVDDEFAEKFTFCAHQLLSERREEGNARLSTEIQRLARQTFQNDDLYAREKRHANELLLDNYAYWTSVVNYSKNPFATAAKLAVIGNIIDYGAHIVLDDISKQISDFFQQELSIDQTAALKSEIEHAEHVLYLGDNCGEIVFDKLFIETMNHPKVTFVTRGGPVINDATLEDAAMVGMDKVCEVISNGADAPSTLLDLCSSEFQKLFQTADLIISKGQGNYEGLAYSGQFNIFFLLIAKCDPVAETLGVNKNDMVVVQKFQSSK